MSYDDANLYVVFVCEDDPAQVRAHLTRRDDVASEDGVVIYLDTFHDHRHAYVFFANPLGIQLDALWTEGQGRDDSFDTLWYAEGRLTGDGYVVWMAIPFNSLRFPRRSVQQWGIALGRVIRRNTEEADWPLISQRVESFAGQFATLEGLERISPAWNLRLIPYAASRRARFLDRTAPGAAAFRRDADARVGLDTKVVLLSALTFDATITPDFSQVESDTPKVTTNQRFEVFFPEKRPFFLENAGYFQTPTILFFSRRIRDPQLGVRLTGKGGPWSFGAIVVDDRNADSAELSGERQQAVIGVGRLQREFHNQSTVGLVVTHREADSSSNQVYSADVRLKLGPNWVVSGQAIGSRTRQAGGRLVTGAAYWVEVARSGRNLVYASRYTDRSPEFRSDPGFVPRVDVRQIEQYVRYYWRPERSPMLAIGPELKLQANWNRRGQLQDWVVDISFGTDLRGPTGLGCRYVNAYELFQGLGFRRHITDCGINSSWLGWLELNADFGWGSGVNYVPAPGVPPFVGGSTNAHLDFTVRPSPGIRWGVTYLYSGLTAPRPSPLPRRPGAHIFEDHILRTKVAYQLTREISLRGIVDYHAILPDTELVAVEPSKRLTLDVLLTWLVNPGTGLYLGYTGTYESVEADVPWRYRAGLPRVSTGRQWFVKLSYLIGP